MAINFEFGTLIAGRQGSVNGAFNADINTEVCNKKTNANLTIRIRICFKQINPTATKKTHPDWDAKYGNPKGPEIPIQPWTKMEWAKWKGRFITIVQNKWNGKFWLETPLYFDGLNWPKLKPTHRCNLYCRIKVTEQSSTLGASAVIDVVKINKKQNFRSDMFTYSNQIIHGTACSHEIGHLIGLDHPGKYYWIFAGCHDGGEDICYFDKNGNSDGLMGMGNKIGEDYAKPWLMAAGLLTGTNEADWRVHLKRVYPAPILPRPPLL